MRMKIKLPPRLFLFSLFLLIIIVALLKKWFPSWFQKPIPAVSKVSKGEDACHKALKELFPKHVFQKKRPEWLINSATGKRMELDLFNEELAIAVEYNGRQHYEFTPHFHGEVENFHKQLKRDDEKVETCMKKGIFLITVPHTIPNNDIKDFIQSEIQRILV